MKLDPFGCSRKLGATALRTALAKPSMVGVLANGPTFRTTATQVSIAAVAANP
jgi:hypothetical protein